MKTMLNKSIHCLARVAVTLFAWTPATKTIALFRRVCANIDDNGNSDTLMCAVAEFLTQSFFDLLINLWWKLRRIFLNEFCAVYWVSYSEWMAKTIKLNLECVWSKSNYNRINVHNSKEVILCRHYPQSSVHIFSHYIHIRCQPRWIELELYVSCPTVQTQQKRKNQMVFFIYSKKI